MIIAVNFPTLAAGKKKPEKNQGFNGIRTRDLRDTGAVSRIVQDGAVGRTRNSPV